MFQRYLTAGGLIAWVHSLCEEFNALELCLPDASPGKPAFSCTPTSSKPPAGSCWPVRSCLVQSCSYFSKDQKWFFFTSCCTVEPGTWPSLITLLPQFPPAFSLTSAVCSSSFYFLSVRISDAKTFASFKPLYCVPLWYKQPWTLPKCYWTDATLCYITELHNGGCMLSRADSNQEELLSSTCQRYWNKLPLMGSVSEF